jgi:hypothetical protein
MENKIHHNFKVFKQTKKLFIPKLFFILYKFFSNDNKWFVDCVMNCYLHKMCFT